MHADGIKCQLKNDICLFFLFFASAVYYYVCQACMLFFGWGVLTSNVTGTPWVPFY